MDKTEASKVIQLFKNGKTITRSNYHEGSREKISYDPEKEIFVQHIEYAYDCSDFNKFMNEKEFYNQVLKFGKYEDFINELE